MIDEPILALDDIQGNILPGFKKDSQHFIFFRIVDPTAARSWLKGLAPRLSNAKEVIAAHNLWKAMRRRLGRDPDNLDFLFLNCAMSAAGLSKLQVPNVEAFDDDAFKIGLEDRATTIGDPKPGTAQPGATDTWLFGAGRKRPDVLVVLATDDLKWAIQSERELIASAKEQGLQLIHVDRGRVRPGAMAGHEHFGFKDGISFPAIRGRASVVLDDFVEPRTWPPGSDFDSYRSRYASPGRQLVWPGHFLFGYLRQNKDKPEEPTSEPAGPDWAKNGSFLVYRRLRQDVAAFHSFLASAAVNLNSNGFNPSITPDRLGALLVGRWASGWPVMRDAEIDRGTNNLGENYFGFSSATTAALPSDINPLNQADPSGKVCPFAAHIRKVNPRDDSTDKGPMERTFQRLLLRRGITFGPEMDQPDKERGLLFVAFQTSIVEQFEFLMDHWVNDENKPKSNGGIDPIIGFTNNKPIHLSDRAVPHQLPIPGGWVVATGGEYMFAPGIHFFLDVL